MKKKLLKFPKPRKVEKKKSYWKRKADILLSKFICSLDHCERCSVTRNQAQLQTAHVITRSNLRLRYDINNLLCLCAKCHWDWHKNPLESIMWFNDAYKERSKYLMKHRNEFLKLTIDDYKEIIKNLENYTN